jgi:hypothetical protein
LLSRKSRVCHSPHDRVGSRPPAQRGIAVPILSFVSVTQQFNTTTSMGRLTLNMLLSYGFRLIDSMFEGDSRVLAMRLV